MANCCAGTTVSEYAIVGTVEIDPNQAAACDLGTVGISQVVVSNLLGETPPVCGGLDTPCPALVSALSIIHLLSSSFDT